MNRNYKVKIETEEEFFTDLIANAEKLDKGVIPEKTVGNHYLLLKQIIYLHRF